ncbi:uncharacterized protein LOC133169562 isoform X2 [Syngnathus typhle]|uniref:uncharacterized protein LOC133169562 isoform X2 n=1 Tax=Syngnathus typhle TaxID=161592 RepID=UPI002A6A758F|nr:uncharacterized protein LOC133169562 isoform X2 [Syngnathus typhle]
MTLSRGLFLCYVFCTVDIQPARTAANTSATIEDAQGTLPALQLTATPAFPVAEGQKVSLRCCAPSSPAFHNWHWQREEQKTWKKVAKGGQLTLSEPRQSGLYRCLAQSNQSESVSSSHAVFIISLHATANIGIAALALSLLALIMNIAIMFWLGWQGLRDKRCAASTGAKGFPRAIKEANGGLPHTVTDGHVYMNYSSTNLTYTDLDATSVTADSTYSVLP